MPKGHSRYGYDGNGNAVEVTDPNNHTTAFFFDKDGMLVMVENANEIKTIWEYDSRHNNTKILIGAEASWDAANRSVTVEDITNAQVVTNIYDEFNQLIRYIDGVGNALAESNDELYQQMRIKHS